MSEKKSRENYIGPRGYSLIKENFTTGQLNEIRKELTVKPFVNKQFSAEASPFSVFLESKKKLYMPKHYGIEKFGLPSINKSEDLGKDIKITFNSSLRPKQIPVAEKYIQVAKEKGGGIISVPCGFGKTVLALYILCQLGKKAIVIVHKEFLMDQWK